MFNMRTAKQVEAENIEIMQKNREHDNRRRADNTPARRVSKAVAGAQRLLKKLERDGLATQKARDIVARMVSNQKVFTDCEAELAKKTISAQDVAKAQAVTELLKKLPHCFTSEGDAVFFAEKLNFSTAYDADMKAHDQRNKVTKKRTKALDAVLNDAEQLGQVSGLFSGDIVKQVIALGEMD
jgi:hypothetical protein